MEAELPESSGVSAAVEESPDDGEEKKEEGPSPPDPHAAVDDENEQPAPKFSVLQKVYARDKDGLLYVAVIRRLLYGPRYQRQVQMGLVGSNEEAEELLKEETSPGWHYFVHYSNWSVNFDIWVSEDDLFELTDQVKQYADRLTKEHRKLQQEMRKKVKGKKAFQTVDGAAFLNAWKKRMLKVHREKAFLNPNAALPAVSAEAVESQPIIFEQDNGKPKQKKLWTKAALATERSLREKGLTSQRVRTNAIVLPFALKKVLVEQWELITQCQMLPSLPATTTVRQALDQYLESKTDSLKRAESNENVTAELVQTETTTRAENSAIASEPPAAHNAKEESPDEVKSQASNNMSPKQAEWRDNVTAEVIQSETTPAMNSATKEDSSDDAATKEAMDREQEWRNMADGIAMLFDDALEPNLLYREELPQIRVLDSESSYSQIYGCEHLLRLFVRLPDMLVDHLSDEEIRPIVAKVNDFIRFLHKNQGTLLTQRHRKPIEAEMQEVAELNEKKRKSRRTEPEQTSSKRARTKAEAKE